MFDLEDFIDFIDFIDEDGGDDFFGDDDDNDFVFFLFKVCIFDDDFLVFDFEGDDV